TSVIRVISAICCMNTSEASTTPREMAMTISTNTVSDKHTTSTMMSCTGALLLRLTTLSASLIFHATISSGAAMRGMGKWLSQRASTTPENSGTHEGV